MTERPMTHPRRLIPLVAIMSSVLIAACGSPKLRRTTTSAQSATALKYSECMRAHGVPDFPDPSPHGAIDIIRKVGFYEVNSPAFLSASNTCAKLLPGGGPSGPGFTEKQLQQMIAKVQCIRQHGFPDMPDPGANGDNIGLGTDPPGWNPQAPAAITARKACAKVGTVIPGWVVQWNGFDG